MQSLEDYFYLIVCGIELSLLRSKGSSKTKFERRSSLRAQAAVASATADILG